MRLNSELIVVSDLHIAGTNDPKFEPLFQILDAIEAEHTPFFVLNGDVFDFFLGDRKYFYEKFKIFFDRLERIASTGTKVIFNEGNHEFHLNRLQLHNVEIKTEDFVVELPKTRVAFTHGDLIFEDRTYELFRKFIKSSSFRCAALAVPSPTLDFLTARISRVSRSRDDYRTLDQTKLLNRSHDWLKKMECSVGVFGHFHVPIAHTFPDGLAIYSVQDWTQPNCLSFDGKAVDYLTFQEGKWR